MGDRLRRVRVLFLCVVLGLSLYQTMESVLHGKQGRDVIINGKDVVDPAVVIADVKGAGF